MTQGYDSGALDERRLRELIDVGRSLVAELDPEVDLPPRARGRLRADRRPLRRARRARRRPPRARALHHPRHRRGDPPGDRQPAPRPRRARPADRAAAPAAPRRRRRAIPAPTASPRPPADDQLPRRAGDDPRPRLGQPLPDREGGGRLRRGRRAVGDDPRRVGGDRGRERPPLPQRRRPAATRWSAPCTGSKRRPRSPARSAARPTSTASWRSSSSGAAPWSRRARC